MIRGRKKKGAVFETCPFLICRADSYSANSRENSNPPRLTITSTTNNIPARFE